MRLTVLFLTSLCMTNFMLCQNSFAQNMACELPYDLEGVQELRSFAVTATSSLTPLQNAQVRATAERWAVQMDYDEYTSFEHSIQAMKGDSEGEELNYTVFRYNGAVFTQVILYPGGNAYGVIFQGKKLLAEQRDGDIICEKSLRITL